MPTEKEKLDKEMAEIAKPTGSEDPTVLSLEKLIETRKAEYDAAGTPELVLKLANQLRQLDTTRRARLHAIKDPEGE